MADGVEITPGTGATVLTDDCGAPGHAQVVKLAYSADGTATHVPADASGLLVNTELPAAAAISAENTAAPTAPSVYSFNMVFDGSNWDRSAGNSTDGLLVNLGTNNDVTVTGTVTVDTELPAAATISAENTAAPSAPSIYAFGLLFDGTNWDRAAGNSTDGALVNLGANNDVTVTGTVSVSGTVTVDSELSTAAAISAENTAAPTTSNIYAFNMMFDGSNWDRMAGTSTDGLLVNLGTNNDVTVTSGAVTATLAAGTNTNEVVGDVAQDIPVAGNPVLIGFRASTAVPSAMSGDGDAVYPWANRNGAQVQTAAPHVGLNSDPWNLVHECAQYTTTQTSTVLVAGGASEKLVVTKVQIQASGTTAGDMQLYFGTGAYSRGTSRALFDGNFKPSATSAPGIFMEGPFIAGTNGDDLMVTTSAAINPLTVNVWYYVVT